MRLRRETSNHKVNLHWHSILHMPTSQLLALHHLVLEGGSCHPFSHLFFCMVSSWSLLHPCLPSILNEAVEKMSNPLGMHDRNTFFPSPKYTSWTVWQVCSLWLLPTFLPPSIPQPFEVLCHCECDCLNSKNFRLFALASCCLRCCCHDVGVVDELSSCSLSMQIGYGGRWRSGGLRWWKVQ